MAVAKRRLVRKGGSGPQCSLSRVERAPHVKDMVRKFYNRKRFAAHYEVGVEKWGRLKADVVLINMKRQILIVEVKSCWADFNTDSKWHRYIKHADKFYFAFMSEIWDVIGERVLSVIKQTSAGVIVVPTDARCVKSVRVIKPAKSNTSLSQEDRLWLLTKLACKAGDWN